MATLELDIVELDNRTDSNLNVTLMYDRRRKEVILIVNDNETCENYSVVIDPMKARDAFNHPMVYVVEQA